MLSRAPWTPEPRRKCFTKLGVSHAEGEYIAFLDAEEVWVPHKLAQQVAILGSHPEATMLYGNTRYQYSWTGNSEDSQRDFVPELVVRSDTLVERQCY